MSSRCIKALELATKAVKLDMDGDEVLAAKMYRDAARELEDALKQTNSNNANSSFSEDDRKQITLKIKEYRDRADVIGKDSVNEKKQSGSVMAGAAAAGAMIGFAMTGPVGAIGMAASMGWASTKKSGLMSTVSKASGKAVLRGVDMAKNANRKYELDTKAKEYSKIGMQKAKEIDEKYKIREKTIAGATAAGKYIEENYLSSKDVGKLPSTPK